MTRFLRVTLAAVSLAASIVIAELALRAAGYQYSPLQVGANVSGDWREEHAFRDRHLVYDPDLIWRPVSGQFSPFNPQGFRGLPVSPDKPPGTFRLVAVGDSNTFGWAVDEGANWPEQLQRRLAATRPGAEVINAGVWGYTAYQGLRRFREMLAFGPDLVLVSFGANDAHPVEVPDSEYVQRHNRLDRLNRATRRLRLAQLVVAGWDRLASIGAPGELVPRVSIDDFRSHLLEIVRDARQRNILVVLLTRPFVGSSSDPMSWKTFAPAYNEATRDLARAEQVPIVDVYEAFRECGECFDDEAHFGVEGHRRAAELIAAAIAPLLPP